MTASHHLRTLGGLSLLLLGIAFTTVLRAQPVTPPSTRTAQTVVPETGPRPGRATGSEESTCLIEPSKDLQIGTPVDGILEQLLVDRGHIVGVGQVLARLNTGVEAAAVETQAARSAFGQRKLERNRELQARQLISAQEADELATEQRLADLELRERQERLLLRIIKSPIRGVVVDVYRHVGDLVRQEKILRLMQLDPLYIETIVPARMFGRFRVGQSYGVVTELGSQRHAAVVQSVDRVIDAASGTFRVRLTLPNPKLDIPPGQRCSLQFETR